jgi:drug/metabolite transporter (DMT)-like permease
MVPSMLLLAFSHPAETFQHHESGQAWTSLACIAILGLAGTAGSLILFNRLILATSALYASSVTYLIPVVALLWGWLDNEPVGIFQVMGMLAILTGVYLVNSRRGETTSV